MNRLPLILIGAAALIGCSEEGRTSVGAQLLVPDSVEVRWDDRLNQSADGLGILVPVDLMVYEGATGEPLDFVRLDVNTSADAVVLDLDDVEPLASDCVDCVWDSGRDRYVVLPDPNDAQQPLLTDADGLARIYVWIDAFPTAQNELLPIEVDVDSEESGATFDIHGI